MKGFFKPEKEGARISPVEAHGSFNEMYATHVNAARQWRYVSYGAIAVAIIAAGGLVAVSLQHKVVPYAIEFNEHAEAVRVIRADEMQQPNRLQVRAALRNWLVEVRTVYVDRRAQDNLVKAATAMTLAQSSAYQSLANFYQENNPYERSEKLTVEAVVNSVNPISDKTWLIEWTETMRDRSGRVLDTRVWQSSVTVAIVPPTDESRVLVNPIGLYVEQFSWGQRQ
jgi:type IV secretion system protein TrbF